MKFTQTASGKNRNPLEFFLLQLNVGKSRHHLFDGDAGLNSRQLGTDAGVNPFSESEMRVGVSCDVKSLWVFELARVAVCRRQA